MEQRDNQLATYKLLSFMTIRRTKIIATLGPATEEPHSLRGIIQAGTDVVRLNFSHGNHASHKKLVDMTREIARELGRNVGILGDLQGPKIRIGKFIEGSIELVEGQTFILDAALANDAGTANCVGVTYKDLPRDVNPGDTLLLDDGLMALSVDYIRDDKIHCTVTGGGRLRNHKGVNRLGGGLSVEALTDKDYADIRFAAELDVDFLAVSFPRSAADIETTRKLFRQEGGRGDIVAKIERAEAIDNLTEIIQAADALLVARGDLGVEIGDAELPGLQKKIIRESLANGKVVITATQMMQSMVESPIPTRAEVLDVANAVIDGSDAVMLSEETAAGKHPSKVVAAMHRVCVGAEKQMESFSKSRRLPRIFTRIDQVVAMAAMFTANTVNVDAIIALTESGATALWLSRVRSTTPIYALTSHQQTLGRVTLYSGVHPLLFDPGNNKPEKLVDLAIQALFNQGLVVEGNRVLITLGDTTGELGGTNTLKLIKVGQEGKPVNPALDAPQTDII